MLTIRDYRRQLIVSHPTFLCPLNGEILDVDESYIISFVNPKNNSRKIEVVSVRGFNSIDREKRLMFDFKIIYNIEEL